MAIPRILFTPDIFHLQPSITQTINVTVSLHEPIITPSGLDDIGLTIQFTSSVSSITIPDVVWPPGTVGVPDPITVAITASANTYGSSTDIITTNIITNSELYNGFIPYFSVNYTRPLPMGSLFSDNSLVYYKSNSLSSGTGSVRNSRAKGRRT
jgi:hypothetical protein